MEMQGGAFVALEGGEGSGKDANIAYLKQSFSHRNDIVFTREPGGTVLGERLRSILMDADSEDMSIETELFLFLAARAQLIREVIRPALRAGKHVITNRFGLSTIAYQIYRKERYEYRVLLEQLGRLCTDDIAPYYIFLDLEPELGLARTQTREGEVTRFDRENLATHRRVRTGYHEAITAFPHVIVDASRPLAEVQETVYLHVARRIFSSPSFVHGSRHITYQPTERT